MGETLWDKITQFNLDHPSGEYSFSVRLACENCWTKDFTEKTILEEYCTKYGSVKAVF